MVNPLKDPLKNPLKVFYEIIWVPFFGRILRTFSSLIEGEQVSDDHTYDLSDIKESKD